MILILALVTATLQPASPKVGDLITVTFPAPVVLDASRDYEVVSRNGNSVVVRTFQPKPFALQGTIGAIHFRNLTVPMGSVLKKGDDLRPAPLAPPRSLPAPRLPWMAIAAAALVAVAVWMLVWWRSRAATVVAAPQIAPEERFRRALQSLREDPSQAQRWAALADVTRTYLGATRSNLGADLTTREIVPRLGEGDAVVVEILRQGDLEKFSTRGPEPADFNEVVERAMDLAS